MYLSLKLTIIKSHLFLYINHIDIQLVDYKKKK